MHTHCTADGEKQPITLLVLHRFCIAYTVTTSKWRFDVVHYLGYWRDSSWPAVDRQWKTWQHDPLVTTWWWQISTKCLKHDQIHICKHSTSLSASYHMPILTVEDTTTVSFSSRSTNTSLWLPGFLWGKTICIGSTISRHRHHTALPHSQTGLSLWGQATASQQVVSRST